MPPEDFTRLANNFHISRGVVSDINRIALDAEFINYFQANQAMKKHKVAFVSICLNPLYWEYANTMIQGATQFFLPGHNTDFLFWTDIPDSLQEATDRLTKDFAPRVDVNDPNVVSRIQAIALSTQEIKKLPNVQLFQTDSVEWPYPTLLRYSLFLQQEEKLKEYDYVFYCDIDMKFVNVVGDEILGQGLTSAQHPMYALSNQYWPPYEPNPESEAYIPRPGKVLNQNGKPRFMPLYHAGGFQGGKSDVWIKAMKEMKEMIDKDLNKNYIPIWNDESIWNKYLFLNPPEIVLTPAYIYPDSLIKEFYEPVWGCSYVPKLMTLTKWFSVSKEGGEHLAKLLNNKVLK